MSTRISPRLAAIVAALPITPHMRVLEIGCGPGAASRAIADRLTTGHILAIDRSARAIAQLLASSTEQITAGTLSARQTAIEDFALAPDEDPFDLAFAIRVGALDGRHPRTGQKAIERIVAATHSRSRLFIDGGRPLLELPLPRPPDPGTHDSSHPNRE